MKYANVTNLQRTSSGGDKLVIEAFDRGTYRGSPKKSPLQKMAYLVYNDHKKGEC